MTALNWNRLAKAEARAPEPFEPLEITRTLVEPGPSGPVPLGVYKRSRTVHPRLPRIVEYFPEVLEKGRGVSTAPAGTGIPNQAPV